MHSRSAQNSCASSNNHGLHCMKGRVWQLLNLWNSCFVRLPSCCNVTGSTGAACVLLLQMASGRWRFWHAACERPCNQHTACERPYSLGCHVHADAPALRERPLPAERKGIDASHSVRIDILQRKIFNIWGEQFLQSQRPLATASWQAGSFEKGAHMQQSLHSW